MTTIPIRGTRHLWLLPLALAALAPAACVPSTPMTAAPMAPFTEGEVDASYEAMGNGVVEIRVKHLGPANRLEAQATTYVVWLTPEGSTVAQNSGAFRVDSDMEATFRFNTSFKKFALAVTPEPSADALAMTGRVVLRADVAAK
jgi:hypothetical protein